MQVICSLFNHEVATPSTRLYPQGNTTTATPVSAAKPKFRKDFHKLHFLAQHASQQSGTPGRPLHNLLVSVYLQWRFTISLKPTIANSRITEPNIFEHSVCPSSTPTEKREKPHDPDRWIATLRPKFPKHTSRLQCPHGCQDPEVLWKVLNQNLWPRINT